MKNTFKFEYYQYAKDDDTSIPYPASTDLNAEFTFDDACTWDVILWQFCKFLEMTGYEGVRGKIKLDDPFGLMSRNCLFDCLTDEENSDFLDYLNDSEESQKEEE